MSAAKKPLCCECRKYRASVCRVMNMGRTAIHHDHICGYCGQRVQSAMYNVVWRKLADCPGATAVAAYFRGPDAEPIPAKEG